jgi:LmbE family N-acetylglucosaminyl deacetylase
MNYLFVVAHPDDESDAAGGTIAKLVSQGHRVAVAIMVSQAAARRNLSDTLATDEEKALAILGVEKVYHAQYQNEHRASSGAGAVH